jgi:hypothetical protein
VNCALILRNGLEEPDGRQTFIFPQEVNTLTTDNSQERARHAIAANPLCSYEREPQRVRRRQRRAFVERTVHRAHRTSGRSGPAPPGPCDRFPRTIPRLQLPPQSKRRRPRAWPAAWFADGRNPRRRCVSGTASHVLYRIRSATVMPALTFDISLKSETNSPFPRPRGSDEPQRIKTSSMNFLRVGIDQLRTGFPQLRLDSRPRPVSGSRRPGQRSH